MAVLSGAAAGASATCIHFKPRAKPARAGTGAGSEPGAGAGGDETAAQRAARLRRDATGSVVAPLVVDFDRSGFFGDEAVERRRRDGLKEAAMVRGEADAMICGLEGRFERHLRNVDLIIGRKPG